MKKINVILLIGLFCLSFQTIYAQTPTVAAPTPTHEAAKVISVFSDAYTNLTTVGIQDWGQVTTVTTENIDGNNYYKIVGLDYLPFVFDPQESIVDMEYIHLDVYTDDADYVRLTFTNWTSGEENQYIDLPYLTPNTWNSVNLKLDDFLTTGTSRGQIGALKFEGNGKNIAVDNIYFYFDNSVADAQPETAAPTPPSRNASDVISIFSNAYTNIVSDILVTDDWGQNTVASVIQVDNDDILKFASFNFHPIPTPNGGHLDISAMAHIHFDAWSANVGSFRLVLNGNNGVEAAKDITLVTDEWNSFDLNLLNDFSNIDLYLLLDLDFVFFQQGTGGNLFLDNIYFHNGTTASVNSTNHIDINMYPNPVINNMTIKSDLFIKNINVYNATGQIVASEIVQNKNETTLNLSDLPAGSYFTKIEFENGKISAQKFVKQ